MSKIAVRARHLSKSYRLYDSPGDRLGHLFGLTRGKGRDHHALSDVSFDIMRGEKVAIIGRNGAGKSTLLKLITRVTAPSSGQLDVYGESRALLQIGTGFHQEFTGRENVSAYLASLGVANPAPLIDEAIAFAELEDYADQPVKTYSTGMTMRLMFAASTMLKPDLLVIDEVLGVGDAYFQRKSFERIRELCEGQATTLLLVTHDIYAAALLCDRMIWIDRGRVLIDADPPTVTRAYEDAIREQEERRLRAKALQHGAERGDRARTQRIVVEIQAAENQPLSAPVWFSRLSLIVNGAPTASIRFGEDAFEQKDGARLQREGANWGEPDFVEGRYARALLPYGSPFHKVAAIFDIPGPAGGIEDLDVSVVVDYRQEAPARLHLAVATADKRIALGELPANAGAWTSHAATLRAGHEAPLPQSQESASLNRWEDWISATAGATQEIEDGKLRLGWNGPAGPYLMVTPPIARSPHEACLVTASIDVRSGRLGFGALDEQGQWARIYEFEARGEEHVLDFPAGADGALRLVMYSASAEPLDVVIGLGEEAALSVTEPTLNRTGVYGAGDMRMEGFRVLDGEGRETLVVNVGEPMRLEIDYRIVRPTLREKAQVLVAFHRNGVQDVLRVLHRDFLFDYEQAETGTVSIAFDPLPLPPGAYSIVVVITAEGYYDTRQSVYFSINPDMYFLQSCAAEIQVAGFWQLYEGAGVVGEAAWSVRPALAASAPRALRAGEEGR